MEEQEGLTFNNLPTEALFNFFCSLHPTLLADYSTVCKKWNQMCRDNELWRRFCVEKWDKNPKESDCIKNWLIPVREGGGSKENRIDWRRCYEIRSLHDRATKFLSSTTKPEKKQRLGFLKRKNAKKSQTDATDLFAKGWPTIDEVLKLEKKVCLHITNPPMDEEDGGNGENMPDFLALTSFFVEVELLIVRQLNISRVKYLGIGGRFLEFITPIVRIFGTMLSERLVKYASRYTELAKDKDVPTDSIAEFLRQIASVFADLIGNVILPRDFNDHLVQFISILITAMSRPLHDGLKQWATEEVNERSNSPTINFEASLHRLSVAMANKTDTQLPLFYDAITKALGTIDTPKKAITMLAVISSITSPIIVHYVLKNLRAFMNAYILPFWKASQDPEYLVPLLYYVSTVYSAIPEQIHTDYIADIIPPLLVMGKHASECVKREVADFVIAYCENMEDTEALMPYLSELLDTLYGYLSCQSVYVRRQAMIAVSSLLITCQPSFLKHKDRMMTEFKKLLGGSDEDRKSAIEALTRVGAGIGDHKSSIETDIESLYDQLVEDCKRDRMAHIDMLLKMTEFSVIVLGPKFSKYAPFVFPLVIEYVRAPVVETSAATAAEGNDQMDIEQDADEEGTPNIPKSFSMEAVSRKDSALASLAKLVELFDRETFLTNQHEIESALFFIIRNPEQNIADHTRHACCVYNGYIRKLFTKDDPNWANTERMRQYWLNSSSMLTELVQASDELSLKTFFVAQITSLFKYFCSIATPEQPFLEPTVMQHFKNVVFEALSTTYYDAEIEQIPFDEIHDFGGEVIDLMEAVCANRTDKKMFWDFAEPILVTSVAMYEENGPDEYRWFDVCLVATIYDYFGEEYLDNNRAIFLRLLPACQEVENSDMYQVISNHLGVMARKYPTMLPHNLNAIDQILSYIEPLLVGDRCQRQEAPSAYDNALMALSCFLMRLTNVIVSTPVSREAALERLLHYLPVLTAALPPAQDGDEIEAKIAIEQFCLIFKTTQIFFVGEEGAELKTNVIRALQETMNMSEYDTPELHAIVDPLLNQLQS